MSIKDVFGNKCIRCNKEFDRKDDEHWCPGCERDNRQKICELKAQAEARRLGAGCPPREKVIRTPSIMYLDGPSSRGGMKVLNGGKAPKVRFKTGQFVKRGDEIWEVIYAYRLKTNPHEWIYCLEERKQIGKSLSDDDKLGHMFNALGCGEGTPRIVFDIFKSSMDAHRFFADIPANGDREDVPNKKMLNEFKIISSGEILDKALDMYD